MREEEGKRVDLNGGRKSKIRGHRRKKERKPVELDGGRKERKEKKTSCRFRQKRGQG